MIPLLGGLLSSWHGGNVPIKAPHVLKSIIWAVPFSLYALHAGIALALVCLILCSLGKSTGHGRGFRLTEPMEEGSKPEKVEYLIRGLYGKIPLYWYKVLIMALTGLAAVSGAVVAFSFVSIPLGLLFALGGLFKGINAIIFDKKTEIREFADGVCAYYPLTLVGGFIG